MVAVDGSVCVSVEVLKCFVHPKDVGFIEVVTDNL